MENLVEHHFKNYRKKYPRWDADLIRVTDSLVTPTEMATIGMYTRGPDQYLHNALPRAHAFLDKYNNKHPFA
jgi:hypothetical protein